MNRPARRPAAARRSTAPSERLSRPWPARCRRRGSRRLLGIRAVQPAAPASGAPLTCTRRRAVDAGIGRRATAGGSEARRDGAGNSTPGGTGERRGAGRRRAGRRARRARRRTATTARPQRRRQRRGRHAAARRRSGRWRQRGCRLPDDLMRAGSRRPDPVSPQRPRRRRAGRSVRQSAAALRRLPPAEQLTRSHGSCPPRRFRARRARPRSAPRPSNRASTRYEAIALAVDAHEAHRQARAAARRRARSGCSPTTPCFCSPTRTSRMLVLPAGCRRCGSPAACRTG